MTDQVTFAERHYSVKELAGPVVPIAGRYPLPVSQRARRAPFRQIQKGAPARLCEHSDSPFGCPTSLFLLPGPRGTAANRETERCTDLFLDKATDFPRWKVA